MPNIINKLEVENSSGITTCDIGAKSENISYGGSNVKSVLDGILNDNNKIDSGDVDLSGYYPTVQEAFTELLTAEGNVNSDKVDVNVSAEDIYATAGHYQENSINSFFENYTHDSTGYVLAKNVDVYDENVSGYYINLQDYLDNINVDVDITDIYATSGYYHDIYSIDGFFTNHTDSNTGYIKARAVLVAGYNEQPSNDVQSIFENILDDNKEHINASSVITSSGYYHNIGIDNFFTQAIDDTTGYVKADGVSLSSGSGTVQDVFDYILLDNNYDVDANKVVIPSNHGYQYADKNLTQVAERAIDKEGYIDDSHTRVDGGDYDGDTYSAAINALADRITALGG